MFRATYLVGVLISMSAAVGIATAAATAASRAMVATAASATVATTARLAGAVPADGDRAAAMDPAAAARFAALALKCLHAEYPNHISHTMDSDADARPPHVLYPAFYGCFDWHSDVHGHWLLVRLVRLFPDAPFAAEARRALAQSLTTAHIAQEVK